MRMNAALFMILCTHSAYAQSVSTDVKLELRSPQATCTLVPQSDADFGTINGWEKTVVLPLNTPARRGQTPGYFILHGYQTSDYMITIEFPNKIIGPGKPLSYEGDWAHSHNTTEPFHTVSGHILYGSAEGPFERHFRVGGRVRGLSVHTPPGLYTGQISITITCH